MVFGRPQHEEAQAGTNIQNLCGAGLLFLRTIYDLPFLCAGDLGKLSSASEPCLGWVGKVSGAWASYFCLARSPEVKEVLSQL